MATGNEEKEKRLCLYSTAASGSPWNKHLGRYPPPGSFACLRYHLRCVVHMCVKGVGSSQEKPTVQRPRRGCTATLPSSICARLPPPHHQRHHLRRRDGETALPSLCGSPAPSLSFFSLDSIAAGSPSPPRPQTIHPCSTTCAVLVFLSLRFPTFLFFLPCEGKKEDSIEKKNQSINIMRQGEESAVWLLSEGAMSTQSRPRLASSLSVPLSLLKYRKNLGRF